MGGEALIWMRWLLAGIGTGAVLVVGWLWSRTFILIDRKADRAETNQRFDRIVTVLDKHVEDDRVVHSAISDKLSQTNQTLAKIEGALAAGREGGQQ